MKGTRLTSLIPLANSLTAMQIFRRSHLPSWLGSAQRPPEAPHDAQVRAWMKRETLPRSLTEPLARTLEKALARHPDTLDLSAADPRAMENLSVSLLLRLKGPTKTLVMPADCPLAIASRLMLEIGADRVEPQALMEQLENSWRGPRTPKPRSPPPSPQPSASTGSSPYIEPVEPPYNASADSIRGPGSDAARRARAQRDLIEARQLPRTQLASVQDVDHALGAMRALNAWLRTRADNEGQHPRCAVSSQDADSIARALRDVPMSALKSHERTSMVAAHAVLASRRPGATLQVDPDTIRHLGAALDAVRVLTAETGDGAPALPERRRRAGG